MCAGARKPEYVGEPAALGPIAWHARVPAPTIAYDNPGTNSDGITTSDSFGGFNGAPDRFDWTARGRSEKFCL